jgi:RNA polymerase sigma factor (sigma-70 family)
MSTTTRKPKMKLGAKLTGHVVAFYDSSDEQHLAPVFAELSRYLNRFSLGTLGIKCPARRDDLVQETLVHVLEQFRNRMFGASPSPRGGYNSLLPWACLVHRNLFINTTRRKKIPSQPNASEASLEMLPESHVAQPEHATLLGATADAAATIATITQAVDNLPPKQRDCFRMFYYEGLPYEEMATRLNIPKTTCRVQVCTALRTLKQWAEHNLSRPSEEVYEALTSTDTGDLFAMSTQRYTPRGFYSMKGSAQKRHYQKRKEALKF